MSKEDYKPKPCVRMYKDLPSDEKWIVDVKDNLELDSKEFNDLFTGSQMEQYANAEHLRITASTSQMNFLNNRAILEFYEEIKWIAEYGDDNLRFRAAKVIEKWRGIVK